MKLEASIFENPYDQFHVDTLSFLLVECHMRFLGQQAKFIAYLNLLEASIFENPYDQFHVNTLSFLLAECHMRFVGQQATP